MAKIVCIILIVSAIVFQHFSQPVYVAALTSVFSPVSLVLVATLQGLLNYCIPHMLLYYFIFITPAPIYLILIIQAYFYSSHQYALFTPYDMAKL